VVLAAATVAVLGIGLLWMRGKGRDRPNLLLVTIDTLRADRVGAYGYAAAETPVLDALAARGVRFEQAQSAIPLTGPSHATIFSGLYPPSHGVRDNVAFSLDARHRTLTSLLKAAGYRTGAFVAAYPVASAFGFGQGFDVFSEKFREGPVPEGGAQRPADEVADDAIPWITRVADAPFFAWVHFYDPHTAYEPPEPYRSRHAGRAYDGEIAFADAQLGRVLEALSTSGLAERTLVAVVADHGESLGDHGEKTHAVLVYEAALRVPFLLAGPGIPAGVTIRDRVGTIDVAPTLLGLLGVAAEPGMLGRDLRPALRGQRLPPEPLYAESLFGRLNCRWSALRAVTDGDFKLIDGARSELFNLAEDPGERHDLAGAQPSRVERLRGLLRAMLARLAPGGDRARAATLSAEQEVMLRSLGYVAGSGGAGELDQPGLPDPRDNVELYERLQVLHGSRALEPALEEARAIAARDPGNPFAHETVGSLAHRAGRIGQAASAYRSALELDASRAVLRRDLGRMLRELGRLRESEAELRLAVSQGRPGDVRTRASLAETLALMGDVEEAGRIVAELAPGAPEDRDVLRAKGRWLAASGRMSEAAKAMSEAATRTDVEPLVEMAAAWLVSGDAAKAQATAAAALQQAPGHPWATALLGHALVKQGRRGEGLAALQRALASGPRRPQAWLGLAEGFEAAGEAATARRCRREAQALASG
jgi:arylsulfatase A-like enzyme/predicted Zn-dependent protease